MPLSAIVRTFNVEFESKVSGFTPSNPRSWEFVFNGDLGSGQNCLGLFSYEGQNTFEIETVEVLNLERIVKLKAKPSSPGAALNFFEFYFDQDWKSFVGVFLGASGERNAMTGSFNSENVITT